MRSLIAAASITLAACASPESQTFGRSYDECVLKNARTGGDESSRETATEICQRRFEREPTTNEVESLERGSSVRFGRVTRELTFPGDGFVPVFVDVEQDDVLVTVRNLSRDFVVLEVETSVVFMDRERTEDGDWPSDAKIVDILTWKLLPYAEPGELGQAVGVFDEGKAPTKFYSSRTKVLRILPLQ